MSAAEEAVHQHHDESHYEISLTAGQAFIAFVLLLLSLAASFAFGLMIGRGQADDRLVVRKEPAVVNEAGVVPKKAAGEIVELGVADDDFKDPEPAKSEPAAAATPVVESPSTETPAITEEATTAPPAGNPAAQQSHAATQQPGTPAAQHSTAATPHFAQLLSTGDVKTAEALAAKLIDKGFTAAYVERTTNEKGPIYRVRVKFASEADARAAEGKLKEFSKDVWITRQ
ncbi:MAG TPA: SPOR domain-containing protein [Thermoanaerobaculia bacterium]|jgi:cell division septation protein DedD